MVGELALITETLSPVTAIAREPATVIRISRNLFRKTLEGYPAAALRLRDMMAKRAEAWANDLVIAIAREPATVIRISRNLFRKTLEGYPAAALRLRDMMAKRAEAWANDLAAVRRKLAAST